MPPELQIAVGVVAILSFGLSLFLAWLRFSETRAKPDLRLSMDWLVGGGEPATLVVIAENRGKARGAVRNIVLSPSETHDRNTSFGFYGHLDDLPVTLDPGAFERFPIKVDPNGPQTFTKRLLSGGFTHAILIDQDQKPRAFAIPPQPTDGENRVSLVGRVAKR